MNTRGKRTPASTQIGKEPVAAVERSVLVASEPKGNAYPVRAATSSAQRVEASEARTSLGTRTDARTTHAAATSLFVDLSERQRAMEGRA
jgi:hypothetical protein